MAEWYKEPMAQETQVQSLGWEDPLEEGMATHFNIFGGKIPWTEVPGGYGPWGRKGPKDPEATEHTHSLQHSLPHSLGSFTLKETIPC